MIGGLGCERRKWRVLKARGMWIVRRPGGAHHGAYFTWREAIAQVLARRVHQGLTTGGDFDRRGSWDYDEGGRSKDFGFCGPVRCASRRDMRITQGREQTWARRDAS